MDFTIKVKKSEIIASRTDVSREERALQPLCKGGLERRRASTLLFFCISFKGNIADYYSGDDKHAANDLYDL